MIYFFEDDALAYLKTKMPMGHRNILQNQTVIMLVLALAFPGSFIITGVLFWLIVNIEYFLIYLVAVWVYLSVLGLIHHKLIGWRPGGERDIRVTF